MSEFKINKNSDTFENNKQKDLSEKERNQFKDEFDEINDLINATLDVPEDADIRSSTVAACPGLQLNIVRIQKLILK